MARRSRLNNPAMEILGQDNGPVVISTTQVSKAAYGVNVNTTQFANLSGFTITANVVEMDNIADQTTHPNDARAGALRQDLLIINRNDTASTFQIYIDVPALITGWTVQPSTGHPVYGELSCVLNDNGTNEQVYEIIRGRIEIVHSANAVASV